MGHYLELAATLIVALATLLTSITGLIRSWRSPEKLTDIHRSVNGRMDELIQAAKAQGRKDERDDQLKHAGIIAVTKAIAVADVTHHDEPTKPGPTRP